MGHGPLGRLFLGGTWILLTTYFASHLGVRKKWRPHYLPSLGRHALIPCASGSSSWGCSKASHQPFLDQKACSHECNMPSKKAAGRNSQLTKDVYNKLEAWRKLVRSLANRPTYLRVLEPFAPS